MKLQYGRKNRQEQFSDFKYRYCESHMSDTLGGLINFYNLINSGEHT